MATTTKMTVKHYDTERKNNTEVFNCDPSIFNAGTIASDTAVVVDTWAKAFTALTTETYDDTVIQTSQSINEVLES